MASALPLNCVGRLPTVVLGSRVPRRKVFGLECRCGPIKPQADSESLLVFHVFRPVCLKRGGRRLCGRVPRLNSIVARRHEGVLQGGKNRLLDFSPRGRCPRGPSGLERPGLGSGAQFSLLFPPILCLFIFLSTTLEMIAAL